MNLDRRAFLGTVAAGLPLGFSAKSWAIDPIRRTGQPHFKLSLAAYSFRQWLDLKKQPKPEWTLSDFIDFAAGQNLDAVELTGYYFAQTTPEYLAGIKLQASRLGLDISGSATGNNFCVTDQAALAKQIAGVKQWLEHTAKLGGKTLRVFAGSVAKGDTEDEAFKRCVDALRSCCEHAAGLGVYVALENHGGITLKAEQLLRFVKAIDHPNFGINLDTGNFHGPDPYEELRQLAAYAVNVQVKTEIQPQGRPKSEADLAQLVTILRKVNYRGYVVLEYEAAENALTAVPRYLTELRKWLRAS